MTDHLTTLFVVGVVALCTVFDVWTLAKRGYSTTISWNLLVVAKAYPIVPFIFGILCGHVLWPNRAATDCAPSAQIVPSAHVVPTMLEPLRATTLATFRTIDECEAENGDSIWLSGNAVCSCADDGMVECATLEDPDDDA